MCGVAVVPKSSCTSGYCSPMINNHPISFSLINRYFFVCPPFRTQVFRPTCVALCTGSRQYSRCSHITRNAIFSVFGVWGPPGVPQGVPRRVVSAPVPTSRNASKAKKGDYQKPRFAITTPVQDCTLRSVCGVAVIPKSSVRAGTARL